MAKRSPRGRFVWYELMTTDPQSAMGFYTQVMGWSTSPFEAAGTPYTMWMNGEVPVGGVMQLPAPAAAAGAPPHWLAYIGTTDVDDTVAKAQKHGATVLVPPHAIPTVGRFAVLEDPQGAIFAAFTPEGDTPGHGGRPRIGEFSWHELATRDHEAAFEFYRKLFGWKRTDAMDMGEMGTYQMYGRGKETLGGMFNKSLEMPGPPAWLLYVRVPDVDGAVATVQRLGGQVPNGPMEVPGGDRIAQCLDPQGTAFAVHMVAS